MIIVLDNIIHFRTSELFENIISAFVEDLAVMFH